MRCIDIVSWPIFATAGAKEFFIILLYQIFSNHLVEGETPRGCCGMVELNAYYKAFCQREPIGGMFLESVLEELIDRVRNEKTV